MDKEQTIKKAQELEAELSALALKYSLTTYSLIGFMECDSVSSYPVCVCWVRDDTPVHYRHPKIIKFLFGSSVEVIKHMTGNEFFHEEHHGKFNHKKPKNDK